MESLRLSRLTGGRIGVARGLETFAVLADQEGRIELAVMLIATASAIREAAGLPPLLTGQTRQLKHGRNLDAESVERLWNQGRILTPDAAVSLALSDGGNITGRPAADIMTQPSAFSARPGVVPASTLTAREREITALIARGYSNKAIADELAISLGTAARHVANILAKLGFTSRAQIAAWVTGSGAGHLERKREEQENLDATRA